MVLDTANQKKSLEIPTFCEESAGDVPSQIVDRVLTWLGGQEDVKRIASAREDFQLATGTVFESDPCYEERSGYFLDHLVFERRLNSGQTAFEQWRQETYDDDDDDVRAIAAEVVNAQQCLFEILKVTRKRLHVRELLDNKKMTVEPSGELQFTGLSKGDVIQCFTLHRQDSSWVSRSLIIHPMEVLKTIRKSIKTQRRSNADFSRVARRIFLSHLARQQMRHFRHIHVDPRIIYEEEVGSTRQFLKS